MKKFPTKLTDLPNIGEASAAQLKRAGINCVEELRKAGSKQAFLKIRAFDPGACLSLLCALEGAIHGTRWHHVPVNKKRELKSFIDHLNKSHVGS